MEGSIIIENNNDNQGADTFVSPSVSWYYIIDSKHLYLWASPVNVLIIDALPIILQSKNIIREIAFILEEYKSYIKNIYLLTSLKGIR